MEQFTKEELNVLGLIISNATIQGKDAPVIVVLLQKIQKMLKEEDTIVE